MGLPAIEKIKEWDGDELLKWIQDNRKKALKGDTLEKFKAADIDGATFLKHAGKKEYFREECNLPIGTSGRLADLASEMAQEGKEQDTTDPKTRKRKSLPDTGIVPSPKRTRVGKSSLIINSELEHFRSGPITFSNVLQKEGQAYFDRTRYIFKLHKLDNFILFCRPRRFGKSLTVSMLEHFHGLQYAGEHQSLYKDLDVQKDIDERKVNPGQYFVLTFDFSRINPSRDPTEAHEALVEFLNSSLKTFYRVYTTYLGGNFANLCQNIHSKQPSLSLWWCAEVVRDAIKQDERLTGIQGIYVLVDEYDAFPNNFLELSKTVGGSKTAWEDTPVGLTFKTFWATMKSLGTTGFIQKIFVTGISPLSLSNLGSAFNVTRNLSFHKDLVGLCGLTYSDLEDALKEIFKDPGAYYDVLLEMTKFFDGYHFCKDETVETVYNTETCLAYLQCCIERVIPETQDPPNSEVSGQFLRMFATSSSTIRDFEKALEFDENTGFAPLKYTQFRSEFTLQDLSEVGDDSAWRSLLVYFGGLTFHPDEPKKHLKIPNNVAADRIALAVLEKYDLRSSLPEALQYLVDDGKLERVLGCYRGLMMQRDITTYDLTETRERDHRDSFYFCLLRNHFLVPRTEFEVIKPNKRKGRIDLLFQVPGRLIVTEWKFYRINFLDIEAEGNTNPAKAAILCDYKLPDILQLKFGARDIHHQGTIGAQVMGNDASQLRDYIKSTEVQQRVEKGNLKLQAHLVIIIGSRHILLWDMDEKGKLAPQPCLVEVPSRSNRRDSRGYYS